MKPTRGRPRSRRNLLAGVGAAAAGLALLPRLGKGVEPPSLYFYNWDTYIGETTLDDFEQLSGIDVVADFYADNDELFARLEGGNPGYDVIVPTNDYVERMIASRMLAPLNHGLIPNRKNIDPAFQDAAFDPGRRYSLPYLWGSQGIGYRKSAVRSVPDSWKVLLDSADHSGRIALLGENAIGAALKYLGYSYNATDAGQIRQAEELLIRQKPHVRIIADDEGQDLLLSGEVDLAMEWNGDTLQVMEEDGDISYVVPREGGLMWQDCLCIPKGARHPENAHKFINFILDAKAGASIAGYLYYATPNNAARTLLPEPYNRHPALFPDEATLARCELARTLDQEARRLRRDALARVVAA